MTYSASSPLLATGTVTAEAINAWYAEMGKQYAPQFAPDGQYMPAPPTMGQDIIAVCQRWMLNHDLVAAQIGHESAFTQSRIARLKRNYAGLGAENDDPFGKAITFPTAFEGVRAVAAHLMTYVAGAGEWTAYDPRASATPQAWQGSVHVLSDLDGRWAYPGKGYGASIAALANRLLAFATTGQEPPMAGDDSRFQWVPDLYEFGYPNSQVSGRSGKPIDYLIIHVTEGTDSLAWLTAQHGSSAHYLTNRDATPRAQMVRETDAAWTAGSREYNERGINIEFERYAKDDWTDAEYRNAAATVYPILKRHDIPIVYLGHGSGSKRGIIGHQDVPDGQGGWGGSDHHTDPGPKFNWTTFIGYLTALDAGSQPSPPPPPPGTVVIPPTQPDPWHSPHGEFWIPDAFVDHIRAGDWMTVGYAVAPGMAEDGLFVQYFERARLELHDKTVMRGLVGMEAYRARYGDKP